MLFYNSGKGLNEKYIYILIINLLYIIHLLYERFRLDANQRKKENESFDDMHGRQEGGEKWISRIRNSIISGSVQH